jgi:hypothetical protein
MKKEKKELSKVVLFRKELLKLMPGYNWTVRRQTCPEYLEALGSISSGFNRISTILVSRRDTEFYAYQVKISGYGLRCPWTGEQTGRTLAQALRALQSHCEHEAAKYRAAANHLQEARGRK